MPKIPELKNKIIADIGCNNGYYMFRMAAHSPKLVLGFEPYVEAVAEFLVHKDTQPPLTISVEGEWGSGKSSFMWQLKNEIKNDLLGKVSKNFTKKIQH